MLHWVFVALSLHSSNNTYNRGHMRYKRASAWSM